MKPLSGGSRDFYLESPPPDTGRPSLIFPEYTRYDALGLAHLVASRQVSAKEVLEAAIERIETLNPNYNAVIHRFYERARDTLARDPGAGPLRGVPFLLKDTLELEGTPASFASRITAKFVCTETHELVRRFERAGLLILGRTNMSELGLLPTTEPGLYGATKNPWHEDYSVGGSSGGAAAAVASLMVPMAHADDGGGSIRIPAAATGTFGLKPSRGMNPQGDREAPLGFIQSHCISRSVRDSAALLDASAGPRPGDSYWAPTPSSSFQSAADRDPERLRIAFTTRDFAGHHAHPDCRQAVIKTVELLEALGHHVAEDMPHIDGTAYNEAFTVLWGMCAGYFVKAVAQAARKQLLPRRVGAALNDRQVAAALKRMVGVGGRFALLEPFTRRLLKIDDSHSPGDFWAASSVMQIATRHMAEFFERYDLLLSPVLGEPPWKLGTFQHSWSEDEIRERLERYVGFTQICNTSGLPAMSVPLWENDSGLPIGVQFIAPFASERRLFALAFQLERAQPWQDKLLNLSPLPGAGKPYAPVQNPVPSAAQRT